MLPWALNGAEGPPCDTEESVTVTVSGDRIESSADRRRVRVVGNAQAHHPDVAILADTLWVDTDKEMAAASGHVRVTSENGVLTGDEFVYCFDTGTAFLSNASAALTAETDTGEMTAYVAGRELRYDGESACVIDGSFTTCSTNHPHYAIEARELKLDAEGTITAKSSRIAMYRMRLPRVPTVRIHLGGDAEGTSLAPGVGINTRDVFYVSTSLDLTKKGQRPEVKLDGRLSAQELFRGRMYAAFTGDERRSVEAVIGMNEDVQDEITRSLVVDRLPELRAAGEWSLGSRGSAWYADAAVGNYRESPGRAEAWRESVQVGARHSLRLGGSGEATVELSHRQSFYNSGQSLGVTTAEIGASGTIGRRFQAAARYIGRFDDGQSPFEFDDVDIEQELFTRFGWRLGDWGIGAATRYDIDRGEFGQARLRLSKVFHCIQYGITYDTVLREVGLRVSLPGL
jgi:hypothetical protein